MANEYSQPTRRLVLPSGKTIEVLVFSPSSGEVSPAPHPGAPSEPLHLCPRCDGDLVHPIDWHELPDGKWELALRCPNCRWLGGGAYGHDLVEALDLELERGAETLVHDLRQLTQANMEEELERFAAALHADLILPMDF